MKMEDVTLLIGVDSKHLEELRIVWPTWMKYKPELRGMPCIIFYDLGQVIEKDLNFVNDHPNIRLVPWDHPFARTQREKMLTGFVQTPARLNGGRCSRSSTRSSSMASVCVAHSFHPILTMRCTSFSVRLGFFSGVTCL